MASWRDAPVVGGESAQPAWMAAPRVEPAVIPSGRSDEGDARPVARQEGPARRETRSAGGSLALGARNVIEGILALPSMAADAVAAPVNAVRPGTFAPTSDTVRRALTAIGLPEPASAGERIAGRIVQEGAGLLTGGAIGGALRGAGPIRQAASEMLLSAPGAQVAGAAGAGLAGGVAEEAGAGGVGQAAAGIGGGLVGGLMPTAARLALRDVPAAVIAPLHRGGQDQIIAEALLRQTAQPDTLGVRLQAGMADDSRRLEGAPFTTAMATRDPGLALLESGARNMPVKGGEGDFIPAVAFRSIDAQRDALRLGQVEARVPPVGGPEVNGADVRGALRRQDREGRARISEMYERVDPDGSARLPTAPIRDAFDEVYGRYFHAGTLGGPRDLNTLRAIVDGMGDDGPYRHLQGVRMELSKIIDQANGQPDGARVAAAASRVREAIDTAASTADQPYLPQSSRMTLADVEAQEAQMGAAARPDVAQALAPPAQTLIEPPRGKSLAQFVLEQGGVADTGGEVRNLMGTVRARPGLLNRRGISADEMVQRAREAGYFPDFEAGLRADQVDGLLPNHLFEALDAELRGLAVRRPDGMGLAGRTRTRTLEGEVGREMDQRGLGLETASDQLRALRYDAEAVPAGMRPVDEVRLEAGMTPEQAQMWRDATAARREHGQAFGRDSTGAAGVQRVLAGGEGSPVLQDRSVVETLIRSPDEVRQALRAAGPEAPRVRQAMSDEWFRGLEQAMESTAHQIDGNNQVVRRVAPAALTRYVERSEAVQGLILSPEQRAFVQRLMRDMSETQATQGAAQARGSNTGQNLALEALVARLGLPGQAASLANGAGVLSLGAVPKVVGALYRRSEDDLRIGLARALAEPAEAARLLNGASAGTRARGAYTPADAARERTVMIARALMMGANASAQSHQ